MSKNKTNHSNWIGANYDKIVLLVVLVIILGIAGMLALQTSTGSGASGKKSSIGGDNNSSVLLINTGAISRINDVLGTSYKLDSDSRRLFVGSLRVECVNCRAPIAYESTLCPFCNTAQPTIFVPVDTDGDTMPDKWERQYGLNPQDPSDAESDADGDKFSNVDEFNAKTDPKDSASKPDAMSKIRYTKIEVLPFKLRFLGINKLPNGENSYQLNARTLDRTYFVTNGGVVEGWTVVNVENTAQKKTALQLKQGKRTIQLVQNDIFVDDSYRASFVSLIENKIVSASMKETVRIAGIDYYVVEINLSDVIIKNPVTGTEQKVRKYSQEEVEKRRRGDETESIEKKGFGDFENTSPRLLNDFPAR